MLRPKRDQDQPDAPRSDDQGASLIDADEPLNEAALIHQLADEFASLRAEVRRLNAAGRNQQSTAIKPEHGVFDGNKSHRGLVRHEEAFNVVDDTQDSWPGLRWHVVHLSDAVPGVIDERAAVEVDPGQGDIWSTPAGWLRRLDAREELAGELRLPLTIELLIVALITALAAALRFYQLATMPMGMQGDEATAGLEARRILAEGWVGPYTTTMAGEAMGVIYLVAGVFKVAGESMFTLRFTSAMAGTLAIPALYLAVRQSFGIRYAVVSSLALAVLGWHIHYSRMAFINVVWPLIAILGTLLLVQALRRGDWRWWLAAGGSWGLGLYVYEGHQLLMGLVALFLGIWLFRWVVPVVALAGALVYLTPGLSTAVLLAAVLILVMIALSDLDGRLLLNLAVFALGYVMVGWSMIRYDLDPETGYLVRTRRLSLFESDLWQAQPTSGDKLRLLAERYLDFWEMFSFTPKFNGVTASGNTVLVPSLMLALVVAGMVLAVRYWRLPIVWIGGLVLLGLPMMVVVSVDFADHRVLAMTVFLAMFVGIAIVEVLRFARSAQWPVRLVLTLVLALVVGGAIQTSLVNYFDRTVNASTTHWVMAVEEKEASLFMAELPPDTFVYFYSNRWTFDYEIRRYFAPELQGTSRGTSFDPRLEGVDGAEERQRRFEQIAFDYEPEQTGPRVFVLLGEFMGDLERLRRQHPGGTVTIGPEHPGPVEGPSFIAYALPGDGPPDDISPAEPEVTPTATPRAEPTPTEAADPAPTAAVIPEPPVISTPD